MYKTRFLWDSANEYEKYYRSKHSSIWRSIEKEILKKILVSSDFKDPVLDFACGTWRITQLLEDHFDELTWIDISPDMLEIAKKKLNRTTLKQANILKEDVLQKYNTIFSFRFFLNTENKMRERVFEKLSSHLDQWGYLIFNNHGNARSLKLLYHRINYIKRWEKYRIMSHAYIKNMCRKNNINIIETIWVHYLPWFIHALLSEGLTRKLESFCHRYIPSLFAINVLYVCKKVR